jgi:hypothetical protein
MTAMSEITRLLHRWFEEHKIPSEGFTLVLNFQGVDAAIRFDCALRHELSMTSFIAGKPHPDRLNLARLTMNGVRIQIESPMHEAQS